MRVSPGITDYLVGSTEENTFCWTEGGSVKHEVAFMFGNFPVARCGFKRAEFVGRVDRPRCRRCRPLRAKGAGG